MEESKSTIRFSSQYFLTPLLINPIVTSPPLFKGNENSIRNNYIKLIKDMTFYNSSVSFWLPKTSPGQSSPPMWRKWQSIINNKAYTRYVVCE